ncbi:hypothetical protein ACHAXT_005650 [Thalassiosira profunda]
MSSELRKSLESIQSMLESNPSPAAASSLGSRMQRASREGTEGQRHSSAFSPRHSHTSLGSGGSGGLGGGMGSFHPSAGGAWGTMGGLGSPSNNLAMSLAPLAEPGAGQSLTSPQSQQQVRDSLSYTPYESGRGGGGPAGPPMGGGGGAGVATATQFQTDRGGIGGSPSSAFSAVNKLSPNAGALGMVGGPPFGGSAGGMSGMASGGPLLGGASAGMASVSGAALGLGAGSLHGASGRVPGLDAASMGLRLAHAHGPRRETSLLVSPVSQRPVHERSPQSAQSELSAAAGSVFGSHHASPRNAHDDALSVASIRNDIANRRSGPTGTPVVASASATTAAARSNSTTPATAGLTIHATTMQQQQQQGNTGRDPTPYRYRDNTSASPPAAFQNGRLDDKKGSDASSRSGKDPPAKSPLPTSIKTGGGRAPTVHSGSGCLVTGKSTPNVHSHHYHHAAHHAGGHDHNNELSMIEEDEDHHSLMSNVTGSTFVRTPNMPKKFHAHNGPYGHAKTPGSASTAHTRDRAATPSRDQLLHRPSVHMRESLANLATTTTRDLDQIWDAVGVAPDDRAAQLQDLLEKVHGICDAKVAEEASMQEQFEKEIDDARREWTEACRALRIEEEDPVARMRRDPSAKDLGGGAHGMSLQSEYEAMTARLESLRSVREAAARDLEASRDRMHRAHAAVHGCSIEEAAGAHELQAYADIDSCLTLERREAFRAKADECDENVAARSKAVVSLLLDCQNLIRELEIVPPAEVDVGRCGDDAKIMSSLKKAEGGTSPSHEEAQGRPGMVGRSQSDQYTAVSLFETSDCIGIGNSALERLTDRITELNGEKRRRRVRLGEMGTTISALWKMLRIPREEQQAFTASIGGLGLDTIRKGEAELARLEELKSVVIGKLIGEQREVIRDLWEKTNATAAEKATFDQHYRMEDEHLLTSDLLQEHEVYVAALEAKLAKMQPILDLIAKREGIIEERIELEFLQKDPDRLQGRGATKQLMKEEKMNRRVMKELPKLTAMLERTLKKWYAENKPQGASEAEDGQIVDPDLGHFMYQGAPYLQTMESQEEEWRTRKVRAEQERQAKREEEHAARSASAAFGYNSTYTKLPGKKSSWSAGSRPRSASTARSGSNMRGGSHPSRPGSSNAPRSGSNLRFGGRGPLGDVSSSKQHNARPPSRPRGAPKGGADRGTKTASSGYGSASYRPASAPRMRM